MEKIGTSFVARPFAQFSLKQTLEQQWDFGGATRPALASSAIIDEIAQHYFTTIDIFTTILAFTTAYTDDTA